MINKMLKVMKSLLFSLFAIMVAGSAVAQSTGDDWNWPEDKATAEERYVLYKDALRQDNYKAAKGPLLWLMSNVPDLHNSLYIDGAKVYEGMADNAEDKVSELALQDSALLMYDLRIKYFNDEANVLNRKAFTAYKYYKDNQSKYGQLFDIYKRTFELNGDNVASYLLVPFMDVVRRYKLTNSDFTDAQVIEYYDQVSSIIDKLETSGKKASRVDTYRENIDKILTATVNVDCDFIENNMWPKLEANPDDIKQANKVLSLMYAGECTSSDIFMETVKIIYNNEANYGLGYVLGIQYIKRENYDEAEKYLLEAVDLTEDNTKKAKVYLKLGDINRIQNKYSSARKYYLDAVNTDPTQKDAYKIVGDLYANSFESCKSGENIVKDRAVFIAAYEMYRKAGDTANMARMRTAFPSTEEAFTYDMTKGDAITVGCWINETVSLQTRD